VHIVAKCYVMLPMDACHLLLGRPWLYDNHVIHNGHANTYAFKHNSRRLTLAPLPQPKPHKIKLGKGSEKSLYMSETWMERAISKSKPLFSLLMVESNTSKEVKPLHPLAQSLLKEFEMFSPRMYRWGSLL